MKYKRGDIVIMLEELMYFKKGMKCLILHIAKDNMEVFKIQDKENFFINGNNCRVDFEQATCKLEDFPIEVGQVWAINESIATEYANKQEDWCGLLLLDDFEITIDIINNEFVTVISPDGVNSIAKFEVLKQDLLTKCTLIEPKEKLYVWKRDCINHKQFLSISHTNFTSALHYGELRWLEANDMENCRTRGTRQQWEQWCDEFYLDKSRLDECLVEVTE